MDWIISFAPIATKCIFLSPFPFFPTRSRTRNPFSLRADQEERTNNLLGTRPTLSANQEEIISLSALSLELQYLAGSGDGAGRKMRGGVKEGEEDTPSSDARGQGGASRCAGRGAPRPQSVWGRGQGRIGRHQRLLLGPRRNFSPRNELQGKK